MGEPPREDLDAIRDALNEEAIAALVESMGIEDMRQQASVRAQMRAIVTRYVWHDQRSRGER